MNTGQEPSLINPFPMLESMRGSSNQLLLQYAVVLVLLILRTRSPSRSKPFLFAGAHVPLQVVPRGSNSSERISCHWHPRAQLAGSLLKPRKKKISVVDRTVAGGSRGHSGKLADRSYRRLRSVFHIPELPSLLGNCFPDNSTQKPASAPACA